MKTSKIFTMIAILGLLASCAQTDPHPMDMTQAVQNAKTHEALEKHYEDEAKQMQAKVEEHKKLFEQYKMELYGKEMQSMKNHCDFLIRTYQQAADTNMKMANAHRKMAAEAK